MTIFTDLKAQMSENAPNNQVQTHIKSCCCNSWVAWSSKDQDYDNAHSLRKTTSFYRKLPFFYRRRTNYMSPLCKKVQPHIWALIKNSIHFRHFWWKCPFSSAENGTSGSKTNKQRLLFTEISKKSWLNFLRQSKPKKITKSASG